MESFRQVAIWIIAVVTVAPYSSVWAAAKEHGERLAYNISNCAGWHLQGGSKLVSSQKRKPAFFLVQYSWLSNRAVLRLKVLRLPHWYLCNSTVKTKTNTEHLWHDIYRETPKYLKKTLSQCLHLIHTSLKTLVVLIIKHSRLILLRKKLQFVLKFIPNTYAGLAKCGFSRCYRSRQIQILLCLKGMVKCQTSIVKGLSKPEQLQA